MSAYDSLNAPTRQWVRYVDGRFVLTWQVLMDEGWQRGGTRRLTLLERIGWQLLKRTPAP
jgi:hypothetical protein